MPVFFWVAMLMDFIRFAFIQSRLRGGRFSPKPIKDPVDTGFRNQPKPPWVRHKIIRLKALMPLAGCRRVTDVFNRLYEDTRGMSVSKSYVYNVIKQHQYEIQVLRRKIKHQRPYPAPLNHTWGLDLTGKVDADGNLWMMLGIIDHGSRACLLLQGLEDKSSLTLLRYLLDTLQKYGRPKYIRTDNEAVFCSRVFRTGLWLLGIRHQRTDLHCPLRIFMHPDHLITSMAITE